MSVCVCMRTCVHACVRACVRACMCACVCVFVCGDVSMCVCMCMCVPACLSVCVCMHACVRACVQACMRAPPAPPPQDTSPGMTATRATCLTCCTMIQHHPDAIVQSAAIACLQRLQVFAPLYVDLGSVVPRLCTDLDSPHLLLRRAAANCLRQFTQREPKTVWTICLQALGGESEETEGLERLVLAKLDAESDPKLREDLREVLFSLLTSLAPEDPTKWLLFCNNVLSASEQGSAGREGEPPSLVGAGRPEGDEDEDMAKFTMGEEPQPLTKISPRWPTKVFAVECSRKIYAVCRSDPAHFDLVLAMRRTRTKEGRWRLPMWPMPVSHPLCPPPPSSGGYLVMHLSELVRTSFIAATASVDQLKLAGYEALRVGLSPSSSLPPSLPSSLPPFLPPSLPPSLSPSSSHSLPHSPTLSPYNPHSCGRKYVLVAV